MRFSADLLNVTNAGNRIQENDITGLNLIGGCLLQSRHPDPSGLGCDIPSNIDVTCGSTIPSGSPTADVRGHAVVGIVRGHFGREMFLRSSHLLSGSNPASVNRFRTVSVTPIP
jgi:hypothetical protein